MISDPSIALAFDYKCAREFFNFQNEKEDKREERDREFWIRMFGGKSSNGDGEVEEVEVRLGTR
jgi:hypothetical protein